MNKNIMALILTILTALGGAKVVDEAQDTTPPAKVELIGPTFVEVGELAKFTFHARKVEWLVPTEDSSPVSPESVVMSFRSPGEYDLIVSGLVEHEVQLVKHTIRVEGSVLVPVPLPDVVEPTPAPDVPTPQPDDLEAKDELRDLVRQWCEESEAPVDTCRELADNFIKTASTSETLDDLLRDTSSANSKVDQEGVREVLTKIQLWMIENLTGQSFEDHRCAWDSIGQGLLEYAQGQQ